MCVADDALYLAGIVQYVALFLGRYSILRDLAVSDRDRSNTFRI